MRIILPARTSKKDIKRISELTKDIEISTLNIIERENLIRKILRNVVCRIFPYRFYRFFHHFLRPKKEYSFTIDDKIPNEPLRNIRILLANGQMKKELMQDLFYYLPDLEWIHSTKTGIDHFYSHEIAGRNIILTNSRGLHSKRIAEFVLGCILEASKHISGHINLMRDKKWSEISSTEVEGKIVGILGTGSIGAEVAIKCKAVGMTTIGFSRSAEHNSCFEQIFGQMQLSEILKASDFLVICLPLTDETKGLLGNKELSLMKRQAHIINVGRSEIIQEDALIRILQNKKIAGAILDVFHPEMQLPNHPFYKLKNVILTHYSAHYALNSNQQVFDLFLENLKNFIERRELLNVAKIKEDYHTWR